MISWYWTRFLDNINSIIYKANCKNPFGRNPDICSRPSYLSSFLSSITMMMVVMDGQMNYGVRREYVTSTSFFQPLSAGYHTKTHDTPFCFISVRTALPRIGWIDATELFDANVILFVISLRVGRHHTCFLSPRRAPLSLLLVSLVAATPDIAADPSNMHLFFRF